MTDDLDNPVDDDGGRVPLFDNWCPLHGLGSPCSRLTCAEYRA